MNRTERHNHTNNATGLKHSNVQSSVLAQTDTTTNPERSETSTRANGLKNLRHSGTLSIAIAASWIAVAAMAGIIFWMSANTGTNINEGLGIISAFKGALTSAAQAIFGYEVDVSPVGHFVEYFIFGALLLNALHFHIPLSRALIFAILLGSLYGVTDEFHQYFVPERSCDPMDWLVDTVAVTIGATLCRLAIRSRLSKQATK